MFNEGNTPIMTPDTAWAVPYIIDFSNLAIDAVVAFIVSALLAVMISAEAQAFMAAFLGDSRVGAKDRFHFNAFLHLDILGGICYLWAASAGPALWTSTAVNSNIRVFIR
jgi:hypothetical protein